MAFGISHLNSPTPAKMAKLGVALVSASAFIAGYGLTASVAWVGYTGLGIGVVGTLLVNMFGTDKT